MSEEYFPPVLRMKRWVQFFETYDQLAKETPNARKHQELLRFCWSVSLPKMMDQGLKTLASCLRDNARDFGVDPEEVNRLIEKAREKIGLIEVI